METQKLIKDNTYFVVREFKIDKYIYLGESNQIRNFHEFKTTKFNFIFKVQPECIESYIFDNYDDAKKELMNQYNAEIEKFQKLKKLLTKQNFYV